MTTLTGPRVTTTVHSVREDRPTRTHRVVVAIAAPLKADLVASVGAVDDRLEVLFGLPGDSGAGLRAVVRSNAGLRWVQGTAGGAGEQVGAAGLTEDELARVVITSASGVHAGPLAEFALFGLLALTKGLPRLLADAKTHSWDHYPMGERAGRTVLVVGLGSIGAEVARLAKAFGMRTDAIVVNVGRGGVVDEEVLVDALTQGRLAGAALDFFAVEPLAADSALWDMPNVILSPHTAGLSAHENERIVDLFSENLRRYLAGDELISRVDPTLFY